MVHIGKQIKTTTQYFVLHRLTTLVNLLQQRVLRDCSDLVSSGWCPPPSGIGNNIVFLLINIALDGLSPLGDVKHPDIQLTEEQITVCNEFSVEFSLEIIFGLRRLIYNELVRTYVRLAIVLQQASLFLMSF